MGLSVVLEYKVEKLGLLLVTKCIENQSYQNMPIIKVGLLFLYSSMKKNQKDSANFWHRKMTLKIRIGLFLTFDSKMTERPKNIFMDIFIVLWPYLLTTKLSCLQKNKSGQTKCTAKAFKTVNKQDVSCGPIFVLTFAHICTCKMWVCKAFWNVVF